VNSIGANIVILNWQRPLWEGDQEVMKRSGRDEPIWVAIHLCKETTQRISLYSYAYLKLAKMPWFSYRLCFFFNKIRKRGLNGFFLEAGGRGRE
jgi:hypothetical protein